MVTDDTTPLTRGMNAQARLALEVLRDQAFATAANDAALAERRNHARTVWGLCDIALRDDPRVATLAEPTQCKDWQCTKFEHPHMPLSYCRSGETGCRECVNCGRPARAHQQHDDDQRLATLDEPTPACTGFRCSVIDGRAPYYGIHAEESCPNAPECTCKCGQPYSAHQQPAPAPALFAAMGLPAVTAFPSPAASAALPPMPSLPVFAVLSNNTVAMAADVRALHAEAIALHDALVEARRECERLRDVDACHEKEKERSATLLAGVARERARAEQAERERDEARAAAFAEAETLLLVRRADYERDNMPSAANAMRGAAEAIAALKPLVQP